jgi:hypothetical protein
VDYGAGAAEVRKAFTSLSDERGALDYEELFTQALMRSYMRQNLNVGGNEPEDFIRLLYDVHPQAFDCGDIPMIYLMAGLNVANLHEAADRLIGSFDVKSDFRPVGLYFLGRYFDKNGDYASAAKYFRLLTDRPGFINEGAKIDATLRLGRYYLKEGKISQGRDYIWNSAVWAQESHYNDSYMTDMVAELSRD